MSTLSLRLPESLHEKVRELAEQEDTSINQFITLAVAEKLSALVAEEYLTERAKRGSREKLQRVLAKVRDVEPVPGDELPKQSHPRAGRTKRSTRPRPRGHSTKRVTARSGRGG
jgi:predicted transcriptional regulator